MTAIRKALKAPWMALKNMIPHISRKSMSGSQDIGKTPPRPG
jgi:hypothetical protein